MIHTRIYGCDCLTAEQRNCVGCSRCRIGIRVVEVTRTLIYGSKIEAGGRGESDNIISRFQIGKIIETVGIRSERSIYGIAVTGRTRQGDRHPCYRRLIVVLNTVTVEVFPDIITD